MKCIFRECKNYTPIGSGCLTKRKVSNCTVLKRYKKYRISRNDKRVKL